MLNRIIIANIYIYVLCLFSYNALGQNVHELKTIAASNIKNFYAAVENMMDPDLKMSERRRFKEGAIRGQCDRGQTLLYNNLKTIGSKEYKVGAYLDNVISFFPYGGEFKLKIKAIHGPVHTEDMRMVYFIPEVQSDILDYRNDINYTTHLLFYIGFEQLGDGVYNGGKLISSEVFSEERMIDIKENKIIVVNEDDKQIIKESVNVKEMINSDYLLNGSYFRLCKGGLFDMGHSKDYPHCDPDEQPEITVAIDSFIIQENEVTNDQYLKFLNSYAEDRVKSGEFEGQIMIYPSKNGLQKLDNQWFCNDDDRCRPVVGVTWYGAITFAHYYGLDLPTEEQWEFAARAGNNIDTQLFAGTDSLSHVGFYSINSDMRSQPIKKRIPNRLNLYDLSGNVWEWCNNWYRKRAYSNYTKIKFVEKGSVKSVRGGSFESSAWDCRVQNRWFKDPRSYAHDLGFRCVKNI